MSAELGWTWLVGLLLGGWLVASVVNQFSTDWFRRVARWDVLGLLPRWTFFAPNPADEDVHVIYRDLADAERQVWGSGRVLSKAPAPAWRRWLWNPGRYERKAIIDLANGLRSSRQAVADQPRALCLTTPYVALLDWVSQQPAESATTHRQFILATSTGFPPEQQLRVEYVSEVHRIEP